MSTCTSCDQAWLLCSIIFLNELFDSKTCSTISWSIAWYVCRSGFEICFHDAIGMADVLSLSVKPCSFAGFAHILEFHAFLIVPKLFCHRENFEQLRLEVFVLEKLLNFRFFLWVNIVLIYFIFYRTNKLLVTLLTYFCIFSFTVLPRNVSAVFL